MEQSGISIISPTGITESTVGKSKSIGITLRSSSSIQNAKEKLKAPWLQKLVKEDTTVWDSVLVALGEAIGTAILVFLGCTGCVGSMGVTPPIMQISLTFGFAVMIAIQCVGHISGAHINPAITVAALILGKKSLPMAALYIVAQCLGGLMGYGLLKVITPYDLLNNGSPEKAASFCMTDIHVDMSITQGFLAEVLATGILVFFACGVWDSRNERNSDSLEPGQDTRTSYLERLLVEPLDLLDRPHRWILGGILVLSLPLLAENGAA
ncbi:hypothetical protein KM043_012598 [Ampulex compressa]|nr:hypothetical protein KM043_012598 [Ampulex compressa]